MRLNSAAACLVVLVAVLACPGVRANVAPLPGADAADVHPPMVKQWEFACKENLVSAISIGNDRIAFGAFDSYGVIDSKSGKPVWTKSLSDPAFGASVASDGTNLYVLIGKSRFVACDPKTGATRWGVPETGYWPLPVVSEGKVFTSLAAGEFSAIELRTHHVLWTHEVISRNAPGASDAGKQNAVVASQTTQRTAAVCQGRFLTVFDTTTGRLLWRNVAPLAQDDTLSGMISCLVSAGDSLYCLRQDGDVEAYKVRNGTLQWKSTPKGIAGYYTSAICVGTRLLSVATDGFVRALDLRTGHLAWSHLFTKGETDSIGEPLLVHGNGALIADPQNISEIALPSGNVRWSWNLDQERLSPMYALRFGSRLVLATSGGLMSFIPGKLPSLPIGHTARLNQARTLAAQFVD